EGKKFLEFMSPSDKLSAVHIEDLLKRSNKQGGFIKPKTIDDIEKFILKKASYILPYIEENDELEYKSGAVFHGKKNKMIGTLHGDEMKWLEMLENEYSSQLIEFPYEGKTSVIR